MGAQKLLSPGAGRRVRCLHLEDDDLEEVQLGLGLLLPQLLALCSWLSSNGEFEDNALTSDMPNA